MSTNYLLDEFTQGTLKPAAMKNTRFSTLKTTQTGLKSIAIYHIALFLLAHGHLFGVSEDRLEVLAAFMAFLGALFDPTLSYDKMDSVFAKARRFTDFIESGRWPDLKDEFQSKRNYADLTVILERDLMLFAGQHNCVGLIFEHVNHVKFTAPTKPFFSHVRKHLRFRIKGTVICTIECSGYYLSKKCSIAGFGAPHYQLH